MPGCTEACGGAGHLLDQCATTTIDDGDGDEDDDDDDACVKYAWRMCAHVAPKQTIVLLW